MSQGAWGTWLQIGEAELSKANVRSFCSVMLHQAGNIAFMQISLLILDWAMMLFMGSQLSLKLNYGGALVLLISILCGVRELGGAAESRLSRKKHLL